MTLSPLQKSFLSSVCVSSALFAVTTVPLAMFRSQPVEVQLQNRPVFESELSDLTGPYLGIAGAFSLALGAGILGMSSWRLAASKSEADEAKSSELERNLLAYQAELERIKFSDARLKAQDLDAFLEPQAQPASTAKTPAYTLSAVATPEPVLVNPSQIHGIHHDASASGKKPLTAVPRSHQSEPVKAQNGAATAAASEYAMVMHRLQELTAQVMANQATQPVNETAAFAPATKPLSAHNHQGQVAAPSISHTETAPESQFDLVLNQLKELAAQVEDLRTGGSSQMAA